MAYIYRLTVAYIYRLDDAAGPSRQVVAYHWRPHIQGVAFPHIHPLAAPAELRRLHLATPHATLKDVLTFAMHDYHVRPVREGWEESLARADATLQASMRWAAAQP